jgi:hypothetical protein
MGVSRLAATELSLDFRVELLEKRLYSGMKRHFD